MWALLLVSVLLLSEPDSGEAQLRDVLEPYDFLFDSALEAYYKQDWLAVILNMERALRNKVAVRKIKTDCRLSCANRTAFGAPIPGAGSVEDLEFFQKVLQRAECVSSCETDKLGPLSLHKVTAEMELEFEKRTPYNYLQVAYFKINKIDKAVAAANTFFLANPGHAEMKQNLEYYGLMAGVQETDFKDLEARPHMMEFLEGKRLYSADDFSSSIDHFEAAVEEYFVAYEECRVLCEGAYDYNGNYMEYKADLFQSITDHYLHVLNCKQSCAVELAMSSGRDKPFENFLPSHFNYLQFSYYNSEKYEKAIESAKTYLLFYPEDEVMKQNIAYYSAVLGDDKGTEISARQDVQQYIKKSLLEKELLYFGYEIFGVTFVDPDTWTPADIMPKKLRDKQKADKETAARITEEISNLMKEIEELVEEKTKKSSDIANMINDETSGAEAPLSGNVMLEGITVAMTPEALNGSQRVVLDGVVAADECRELHRLSSAAAKDGDKPNPHLPSEMFQKLTVLQALKLGQEGSIPLKSAQLFFNMSEKVRKVVESIFGLETPLYFIHSHLICRSATEEKKEEAENCLLISELNECLTEPPSSPQQGYRAVLYLNDDFEGGEFIFTEADAKTITAAVKPQCGRVVVFGQENLHGIKAVTKGKRCAVAFHFTQDAQLSEKEHLEAEELFKKLFNPVDADLQKHETPSESGKKETARQDEVKKPTEEEKKEEKSSKSDDVQADPNTASKDVKEVKQQKAKTTGKTKTKTAKTQAKAKPAGQTKAKEADKTKSKTPDKTQKPAAKKTAKTTKKTAKKDSESKQPKAKTSDSQTDKDEL